MIVTIRGTSGSGKSTIVRRIMELYDTCEPRHVPRRSRPLLYALARQTGSPLAVLGHYESPAGGGDTISEGLDYIDGIVREMHRQEHDVLYEGLVVSSDFKRISALHDEGVPVLVVAMSTPLEECIASVEARRRERGNEVPLNPKATIDKYGLVTRMVPRFRERGVPVAHVSREEALHTIREALKI